MPNDSTAPPDERFQDYDDGDEEGADELIPRERLRKAPFQRPTNAPRERSSAPMPPRDPNDHSIYVGHKNAMAYVLAVVTQFREGAREVVLKARGHSISRAVDVYQIVKNRFLQNVGMKSVAFGTDELPSASGEMSKVSTMELVLELTGPMPPQPPAVAHAAEPAAESADAP